MFLLDKDEKICDYCNSVVFPIPEQFLSSEYSINEDSKENFINEYIRISPEFDQNLFDSREKKVKQHINDFEKQNAALEHGKAILEGRDKGNKFGVECPYCHATNVKKISTTSKAVHTAVFGLFSISRNSKQWHCNNCQSDF
ncbi:MAG: hypothetical protein NC251_12650 [Lachnoclostridium sp.]|nr:hypothetical protein [Lachnospira sp.]MCM1249263.1 hypothetical protein [Lachnoclostridium sp.]